MSPVIFIPAGGADRSEVWLHHPRSVADLEAMGAALEEGARVRLAGADGYGAEAWLHFQAEVNCWIAYPTRAG